MNWRGTARRTLTPAEGWRQLDCVARSDEHAVILEEWVQVALRRGEKATGLQRAPDGRPYLLNCPPPWRVVLGVDLAFSTRKTADLSAIVVVLAHPDGSREVLAVEAGRWHGPVLVDRILSAHRRFAAGTVVIESNGAQVLVGQWLKQLGEIPVLPFTTGSGKASLQARIEQLAGEMAHGKWVIPSVSGRARDRESELLVRDLVAYSPRDHVPDRVAALCFAAAGCEQAERKVEFSYMDLLSR